MRIERVSDVQEAHKNFYFLLTRLLIDSFLMKRVIEKPLNLSQPTDTYHMNHGDIQNIHMLCTHERYKAGD